jgi:hypothetical protein
MEQLPKAAKAQRKTLLLFSLKEQFICYPTSSALSHASATIELEIKKSFIGTSRLIVWRKRMNLA